MLEVGCSLEGSSSDAIELELSDEVSSEEISPEEVMSEEVMPDEVFLSSSSSSTEVETESAKNSSYTI